MKTAPRWRLAGCEWRSEGITVIVVGGAAVFLLGRETMGQPLMETLPVSTGVGSG